MNGNHFSSYKSLALYCLPFIWRIIRRYTRSGFDDIDSNLKCSYFENEVSRKKINSSRTTRALFRVNGVSIDYLEMDYKGG